MTWQDVILGIGQVMFFVALIPSMTSSEKPALATCLMTAIILTINVFVIWTLGLYFTFASLILISSGWWILAWQNWQRKRAQD